MRTLIYLPVERYKNRWTEYVSGDRGMFADGCKEFGVELDVIAPDNTLKEITDGVVLDTKQRTEWAFWQTQRLLSRIQSGSINDDTVIYIEDFWHPGFEMIPYACELKGVRPKVFAFCHAQSCDPNDFTHPMKWWMRDMERGWAKWLYGIFVAAKELKQMMTSDDGISPLVDPYYASKIHVTGTVMRRKVIMDMFQAIVDEEQGKMRVPAIVWTSRFDAEKNPQFFIDLALYNQRTEGAEGSETWRFWVLSGRPVPVHWKEAFHNAGIGVFENISKQQYFQTLGRASVMVNAAKQDFVGYCQLDALAMGCAPLCPDYLTFPDLFHGDSMCLYEQDNVVSAYDKLSYLMAMQAQQAVLTHKVPGMYELYGTKYERSVARMLDVMFSEPKLEDIISARRSKNGRIR